MRRRAFISAAIGGGLGAGLLGVPRLLRTDPAESAARTGLNRGQLTAGPTTWSTDRMVRGENLSDGPHVHTGADLAFGTTMTVQVVHADSTIAARAIREALAAAKSVDRLMSLYRADSQVARLNRQGFLENPDPHLLAVLHFARQLSHQTAGSFDITVQPLWQLYAAAAANDTIPDAKERRTAMAATGWQRLQVEANRIGLSPGMAITVNGLAQGYAVDLARQALAAHGIEHALLDTGEFGARGEKSAGEPWTIGVPDPRDAQALLGVLPMDTRFVATSGDYETMFSADHRHHHIFDPATGGSPAELASVTVVAPTGMQADGWSTAFMVLGGRRSIAIVSRLADVDLMLVDKKGMVWRSAGFPGSQPA